MGKRGNNEGTIFQKDNGTWRAQITIGGNRLGYTGKTQRECQAWLKKTIAQIDQGVTFQGMNTKYADLLKEWLEVKKTDLRHNSWVQYETTGRLRLLPNLGSMRMKEITPEVVQRLYLKLQKEGASPRIVRLVHLVLRGSLAYAIRMGLTSSNAAIGAILPAKKQKKMTVWDEDQINQFLMSVRGHRLEVLFNLAIATGMRLSELRGLTWADIDWKGNIVWVRQQVVEEYGRSWYFAPLKTDAGLRQIEVGENTMRLLSVQWNRNQEQKAFTGKRWKEYNLVFPSLQGNPINRYRLTPEFQKLSAKAGLPVIRFHDLRHTAASLMLNHDIPVIVVSRRLGHSKPSITLDIYGHLMPSIKSGAADLMDSYTQSYDVSDLLGDWKPKRHGINTARRYENEEEQ